MYEKLDAMIVESIRFLCGANFSVLSSGDVMDEAIRIANCTGREAFRVIDGRLQALKKRGLIRYVGGEWRIAK